MLKSKKSAFEETASRSRLDMTERLELSDHDFKTTIINTLRVLMNKVDSIQRIDCNVWRDGNSKKEPEKY